MIKNIFDAIRDYVPVDLQVQVRASLTTLQQGLNHHEGPVLRDHLDLVSTVLRGVCDSMFHKDVPQEVRGPMAKAAQQYREQLVPFVLLYKSVFAAHLRGRRDVHPLIVKGIDMHDVAHQFGERGGIDIPLFEQTFGLPFFATDQRKWNLGELAFCLLVNYADQMGSLGADGVPHIEDFLWLARTYLAAYKYCDLLHRLHRMPRESRLEEKKVRRLTDALRVSTSPFESETVPEACARIVSECRLPPI